MAKTEAKSNDTTPNLGLKAKLDAVFATNFKEPRHGG